MNIGKSFIWRILQQYSVYVVKLLVQIVLARLLSPAEFGLIAIVMVFTSIAEIIAVSGLGTALVQKYKPDERDYSTVLSFSILLALFVYIIIFLFSPLIANFYDNSDLVLVLRVYSIVIFFQAYISVLNAYVQKNFLFKRCFWGNLVAVLIAGAISIIVAYKGLGIWSLVIYSNLSAFASIVFIQLFICWHPRIGFDFFRFKPLFSFSWKVLFSSLVGSLLENIYNLAIGKYYGDTILGYYKQGNTYPDAILGQTRTAFSSVMLPVYSSLQNDRKKLADSIYRMTHIVTAVIFPMALGLIAIANTFVSIILTEKWLAAVFFLRLECVFYGTLPITASINNGLISIGRSDISAKIEVSKLFASIICIILFHSFGVRIVCVARVIIAVLFIFVSAVIAHKILGLSLVFVIRSIWKPLVFSIIMSLCVYGVSFLKQNLLIVLLSELIVGVSVYGLLCLLFMREDLKYITDVFKK